MITRRTLVRALSPFAICGLSAVAAVGCRTHFLGLYNYRIATNVSVVSVTPWEDVVDDLTPDFSLTAKEALSEAIPTTGSDTLRSSVGVSATLRGLAVASLASGGASAVSDDSTEADGGSAGSGGTATTATTATTFPDEQSVERRALADLASQTFERDPSMKYNAATALFQHVQLLNRQVRDAAMRNGYEPYLVRLQVAPVPRERDVDLDVSVGIDFAASKVADSKAISDDTVKVVPVMISDTIEATTKAKSVAQLYKFGVALQALAPKMAAEAGLGAVLERVHEQLGEDLTSTLTVSSPGPTKLEVRIGAQNVAGSRVLLPRTYYVSALLLVKRDERLVGTSSATVGKAGAQRDVPASVVVQYFESDGHQPTVDRCDDPKCSKTQQELLSIPIPSYNNDYFAICFQDAERDESQATPNAAPNPRFRKCTVTEPTTVLDDGKSAHVDLGGLVGAGSASYTAVAVVKICGDANREVNLRSTEVKAHRESGYMTLTFPSFTALSSDCGGTPKRYWASGDLVHEIVVYRRTGAWYKKGSQKWPAAFTGISVQSTAAAESAPKSKTAAKEWSAVVGASVLRATASGTGELVVDLSQKGSGHNPPATEVRIDGASVSKLDASCDALEEKDGRLIAKSAKRCKLSLTNLSKRVPVVVKLLVDGNEQTVRTLWVESSKSSNAGKQ